MDEGKIRALLEAVRDGTSSPDEALNALKTLPFEDLGDVRIDHHRALRKGFPEVIFGQGKTDEQVATIFLHLARHDGNLLATRTTHTAWELIHQELPRAEWYEKSCCIALHREKDNNGSGTVAVVTAGTSDIPVAEEAALTVQLMGHETDCLYDVGVAGIHRLFADKERLLRANVIIVVAGMEGALPSVVGGLVARPVIAVPTSVGYGAHFSGLAPLLTMLNSCATGVGVVNIDNGFGAGFLAALINQRVGQE